MQNNLTQSQIKKMHKRVRLKKDYQGYIYMLPFLLLFFVFTFLPIAISFGLSFFSYNGLQTPEFNGLDNYKFLFLKDPEFSITLKNTVIFALFIGPIGYIASFLMAVLLNNLKCRNLFALAFYAPSITSSIGMTVVWMYFFSNDQYGLVNNILIQLGIVETPILWNQDPSYIFPIVVIISVWMSMGTGFLVFLAGLQSMDKSLYEQGSIDGIKNSFQQLIYITIPLMKPQLLFGAINAIAGAFGVFDIPMQFAGFPTPNYVADTLVAHSYDYAFTRFQFGYSAAISVILLVMTFTFGKIVMKALKSD